ncbi:nucleoside 2-deoxyribosyltransferase [Fulvivirga maritima]|uniref:nucleoside 2-deoxyribosyltransferase n=1 Tax=Fulvivirga maritima TaxID=2904247 RepID=UPI001F2D3109|nr:nucleoside 2-deoxyribosyltransferase [Fulvivirga maritima]UII24612.1 nucleoside 2-deoxyribosyltransferase [Fulvivirga maritima]
MSKKIYVASPLGFSEAGRAFMYGNIIPIIEEQGYEILDPWKLTSRELMQPVMDMPYGPEKKQKWSELNKVIGANNAQAIRECSGVVAILDGVDVDSGTAAEIGFATALEKPIIGYRGDFRLSADNEGSTVNLQVQYFIESHGGKVITQLADLKPLLKEIFM